ncbi:MAG: hypothetical protein S4CHLAM37_08620 [Chlamydiia bacterium]|nr:hypothetical protein [Chlamydiia bacterium]
MSFHVDAAHSPPSPAVEQHESMQGGEMDALTRLMQQSLQGFDETVKMCSLKKVSVPKFGSLWRFPSDHLPIGCTVNGKNIVSWNVMNTKYMSWVTERDSQGLNGSLITELNRPIEGKPGFTQRDFAILEDILSMLQSLKTPKHILALQEVSGPLIQELASALPENYQIILPSGNLEEGQYLAPDQNIIIIDTAVFEYVPALSRPLCYGVFSGDMGTRHVMDVILKVHGEDETFRIVNAHIPGDPSLPSRGEFADHVVNPKLAGEGLNEARKHCVTVALGDMNFDEVNMEKAFDIAEVGHDEPLFIRVSPYRTNVGANFDVEGDPLCAKAVDHFFVSRSVNDSRNTIRGMGYKDIYPLQCQTNRLELILNLFKRYTR